MKSEAYFSVDVESAGPIPGMYSMLSLGACLVEDYGQTFYVEFKPITKSFIPAALDVSGLDLDTLELTGVPPDVAMKNFGEWILKSAGERTPVFVGFNGCYDWQFVNWYFHSFTNHNPFGFGGIDIKSYFMGLSGREWSQTTSSQLPEQFHPDVAQTHNALDDARAQASIFRKMLKEHSGRP